MIKITDISEELFLNWKSLQQLSVHQFYRNDNTFSRLRAHLGFNHARTEDLENRDPLKRLEKGAHPWNFFAGPRTDINLNRTRFEHVSWGVPRKWSATTLPANLTSIIRVKVLSKRSHLQHGPVLYDGNRIRGNAPTRLQLAPKLAGKVRDPKTILSYAKKPEYPPPLFST